MAAKLQSLEASVGVHKRLKKSTLRKAGRKEGRRKSLSVTNHYRLYGFDGYGSNQVLVASCVTA